MTIKEIAQLAGVSISTVSKIVNDKAENINIETRERVLKIVKEYNYTPYGTVKNLSTAKTFILGVLLRTAYLTNRTLNGILQAAQEHGYSVLLYDSQNDPDTELRHITSLCKHHVDGVIWEPVSAESSTYRQLFEKQNIAVCYLNAPHTEDSFFIDFVQMGYDMTQKLLDYKHTELACFIKPSSTRSALVLEGFRKCLFANQIPFHNDMIFSSIHEDSLTGMLTRGITGILCTHFASALIFYEQVEKLHYSIPTDISLISLQDDARDAITFPNISKVFIPYREFGHFICQELIRQCEQPNLEPQNHCYQLPTQFNHEETLDAPSSLRLKKIVAVGSVNMDIFLNVDELPQSDKSITCRSYSMAPGGKGANQAVGAAKLGREVSLLGKIGEDYDSSVIYDALKKEQVDTQGVRREKGTITGKAYIHVQKDGKSTITLLKGSNDSFTAADIHTHRHLFERCGYCLLSTEIPYDTIIAAAQTAHQYGAKTIVKPATLSSLPDDLAQLTDILVPNKAEIAALCPAGLSLEEQSQFFLEKGIPVIIHTLGHSGCYLRTQEISRFYEASPVIAVDSTGGADAFISALASYLIEGCSLDQAIKIATYAAGFCVTRQGVVPSLIDRNSLESHIRMIEPDLL